MASSGVEEPTVTTKLMKYKKGLEPVFGLSLQGYCRNMTMQHGGLCGRGPTPSVYMIYIINWSVQGNENPTVLIYESVIMFCQFIPNNIWVF